LAEAIILAALSRGTAADADRAWRNVLSGQALQRRSSEALFQVALCALVTEAPVHRGTDVRPGRPAPNYAHQR